MRPAMGELITGEPHAGDLRWETHPQETAPQETREGSPYIYPTRCFDMVFIREHQIVRKFRYSMFTHVIEQNGRPPG